jgi:methyl-accepting chemotaxis protein
MNISKKLFSGFCAVLLLLIAIAGVSVYQLTSITAQYSFLVSEQVAKVKSASEMKYLVTKEMRDLRGYLITSDKRDEERYTTAKASYNQTAKLIYRLV